MNYPQSLQRLIEDLKNLPGVGEKTAERYALRILEMNDEDVNLFASNLIDVKRKIKHCSRCGNLTEDDLCDVCKDNTRDKSVICVVQESKDAYAIEKTSYNGLYHVLNGVISPSKGVLPQDINLESLLNRLDENVKEVVIAVNPTMDGETTAMYISKLVKEKGIKVTRLALGLSMGSQLDYTDEITLQKALEGRRED